MIDGYQLAQNFVETGTWAIDYDLGLVLGVKRQPFRRTNSWGYIQIKFRRPDDYRLDCAVLAHRVIWESRHGPLDRGHQINHINGQKQDNRLMNLEAVTASQNMAHSYATGLHPLALGNTRLTETQVLEIYRRCHAGERDIPLAAEFGIKRSAVSHIRHGSTWNHLTKHR